MLCLIILRLLTGLIGHFIGMFVYCCQIGCTIDATRDVPISSAKLHTFSVILNNKWKRPSPKVLFKYTLTLTLNWLRNVYQSLHPTKKKRRSSKILCREPLNCIFPFFHDSINFLIKMTMFYFIFKPNNKNISTHKPTKNKIVFCRCYRDHQLFHNI